MKFEEIEKLLLSKHVAIKKNGLAFLYPALKKLGDPHKKLGRVIHITGTNGKGSVAYLLSAILKNAGYKTALYTSPHIDSILERIKINGINISKDEFVRVFNIIYEHSQNLSFFEIMTLIAFYYFSEQKPDFSVIEVGIGGKHDTTNVIDEKELCFITSIDYDHTNILGNTLEEIALQKAGIIKKGSICICPPVSKGLRDIILKETEKNGGKTIFQKNFHKIEKIYLKKNKMLLRNMNSGKKYRIGIIGYRQNTNASLVLRGVEILRAKGFNIPEKAFLKGIDNPHTHARFEFIEKKISGKKTQFIIDGAHNVEAMSFFIKTLRKLKIKKPIFVFSMLSGKDYIAVLKLLRKIAGKIIFTRINSSKAIPPYILANEYQSMNPCADVSVIEDIEQSLILASSNSKIVCICGSFYLASEALKILKGGFKAK